MLTPHHIKYQSHGGSDDLHNLITLCVPCHDDIHAGRVKLEVVSMTPVVNVRFWRR